MLLVIGYSQAARQTLRNVCNAHSETVIRRFGRAALFAETEMGAFLALRAREKHGESVQVERTEPFNEYEDVPKAVREAAIAYEKRDAKSTPYRAFAANTGHPAPESMEGTEL